MSDDYATDTVIRQPSYSQLQASALHGVSIVEAPERRTIHAFDRAPRRISLTWTGQTTCNWRVLVATVREQLQTEAERRAQHRGIPIEQTPEHRICAPSRT
nr:hypothetical protein [uncultured Pseudomonas sp.]